MFFLRDLSNGEAALLIASLVTFVNSIQSIRISRIANRQQEFVEKACFGITLHRITSLIQLMTMAIQSNFHFKAMLDLFGRWAMQPRGTSMALFHNSHKAIATRLAGGMAFRNLVFLFEISGETRLTNRRNGTGSRLQASTRTSQGVDDEESKAVQFACFASACVQRLKALMSLLAGNVSINHVEGIKTTFSFFVL